MKRLPGLCLLFPLWLAAAPPTPPVGDEPSAATAPSSGSQAVQEKFQRMQHEIQSDGGASAPAAAGRSLPLLALEIAFALVLVLGVAVASIRILRRVQRGMLKGSSAGGDLLEVIETCHLGPGQRLVAVRMDGKIGVVGVSKEGISLVATLDRPAGEIIPERRSQGNPAVFADNLNRMLEKFKKPKKVSEFPPG